MDFEWDDAKSLTTLAERGFSFRFAINIFSGHVVEWPDTRFDYGEDRIVAVGRVNGLFLTIVYTDRGPVRRIISARPANGKERRKWLLSE